MVMDGITLAAFLTPIYAKLMWIMWKIGKLEAKIDMINNKR